MAAAFTTYHENKRQWGLSCSLARRKGASCGSTDQERRDPNPLCWLGLRHAMETTDNNGNALHTGPVVHQRSKVQLPDLFLQAVLQALLACLLLRLCQHFSHLPCLPAASDSVTSTCFFGHTRLGSVGHCWGKWWRSS